MTLRQREIGMGLRNSDRPRLPSIGEFVKSRRLRLIDPNTQKPWTQVELGSAINLYPNTYARLERNKYQPGPQVLDALARVFDLTADERAHMGVLAGREVPTAAVFQLPAELEQAVLSAFESRTPAAWVEDWRIVAANLRFRELWPGLADSDNIIRWWLTSEHARKVTPNHEEEARIQVSQFRAFAADESNRERALEMLEQLGDEPEFSRLWNSGTVQLGRPGPRYVWCPREDRFIELADVLVLAGSASMWGRGLYIGLPGAPTLSPPSD